MIVLSDYGVWGVFAAAAFTAAIMLGGIIVLRYYFGPQQRKFEPPIISEWRSTGQIDFVGSDEDMKAEDENAPAQFTLLMQEQRQVANIAGGPTTEIRWRFATKAEVKDVVRRVAREPRVIPEGYPITKESDRAFKAAMDARVQADAAINRARE